MYVNYTLLADYGNWIYILVDFLPGSSEAMERAVLTSPSIIVICLVLFSALLVFASCLLRICCLGYTHVEFIMSS